MDRLINNWIRFFGSGKFPQSKWVWMRSLEVKIFPFLCKNWERKNGKIINLLNLHSTNFSVGFFPKWKKNIFDRSITCVIFMWLFIICLEFFCLLDYYFFLSLLMGFYFIICRTILIFQCLIFVFLILLLYFHFLYLWLFW